MSTRITKAINKIKPCAWRQFFQFTRRAKSRAHIRSLSDHLRTDIGLTREDTANARDRAYVRFDHWH
ncbi:DUF1127 domain-containing protein [uncultured Roseibium sp.]|uniref:DUF1127 domain-containing protein n=1 Tax=uncultured Roseibium sp. TaxID=1936171 RepID=UPI003450D33A